MAGRVRVERAVCRKELRKGSPCRGTLVPPVLPGALTGKIRHGPWRHQARTHTLRPISKSRVHIEYTEKSIHTTCSINRPTDHLHIVLCRETIGRAEVRHACLDAGLVLEVVEDGVVHEAHLLQQARQVVVVNQVPGVVPQREPTLPLERATARQRRAVGVGQPRLQVGTAYAREQIIGW